MVICITGGCVYQLGRAGGRVVARAVLQWAMEAGLAGLGYE